MAWHAEQCNYEFLTNWGQELEFQEVETGEQKFFLIGRLNYLFYFAIFQEIKSWNKHLISWSRWFSGDKKLKQTFNLLKICYSQVQSRDWKLIIMHFLTFDLLKNVTFNLLIGVSTSWKISCLISWNSTSWSFPILTSIVLLCSC